VDHWITRRLKDKRQIRVRVLVAHRSRLERLREQLATWSWRLARVGIADEDQPGKVVGDLLPAHRRSWLVLARGDRLLLRSAGVILGVWVLTVLGQWAYERIEVNAELHKAQDAADRVRQLRARLERDSAPARALAQQERLPDAAETLLTLTDAVPADSWVSSLDVTISTPSAQLRLTALTPVATLLVDRLARTPHFHAVRLLSASSAGVGAGDRLELSATLGSPVAVLPSKSEKPGKERAP
jgi:hypothetical protein